MSTWLNALIAGGTGIAGVATGAVLQARFAREQERRRQLYEPAADLSAKLRGAATSVDYLIRALAASSDAVEADAYERAKYLVEEAYARRAGTELAFPPESRVFETATAAAEALRAALETVRATMAGQRSGPDARRELLAVQAAYEDAIRRFNEAARREIAPQRRAAPRRHPGA